MLRVCTIYSGSNANGTLVEADGIAVLIDAGGGIRKTETALKELGLRYDDLSAIFITHEHIDHINGLPAILKKHRIPVIANEKTLNGIIRRFPEIREYDVLQKMPTGCIAKHDSISIKSFSASHDSQECVGYKVSTVYGSVGICTDTGFLPENVKEQLKGCIAVVIESNHDLIMLRNGPYQPQLKVRIESRFGHLSNDQCGEFLPELVRSGTKQIFLAHLSKDNNTPETAFDSAWKYLRNAGISENEVKVVVSPRNETSEVFTVN